MNNGVTNVGDNLSWGSLSYTLRGTTDFGIVVESVSSPGDFFLLTNDVSYADNQALTGFDTSTAYTYDVACFVGGTAIATPDGDVPVEDPNVGDRVVTADGREVRVTWVGQQRIKNSLLTPLHQAPVCISKGALGGGLPHADLYVSADHGMVLDELVINASALVNGATIRFVPMAEMPGVFTYYHIETEAHDAVLANGAPAADWDAALDDPAMTVSLARGAA